MDTIITLASGITIRRQRPSDISSVVHHMNNYKIWSRLRDRIPYPYTEIDAQSWYQHISNPANHVLCGPWTAENGATGPLIWAHYTIAINDEAVGSIAFEFGSDVYRRSAELGYWLGEAHWGKGVMTQVVPAFVAWGWETFGILVRIDAETSEHNEASAKCLKKAGFVWEGRRENKIYKNGVLMAADNWGALRPDQSGSASKDT